MTFYEQNRAYHNVLDILVNYKVKLPEMVICDDTLQRVDYDFRTKVIDLLFVKHKLDISEMTRQSNGQLDTSFVTTFIVHRDK